MEKMADMKMSKKDKRDSMKVMAASSPDYPWGLEINLDDAALKKLGIEELPDAGCECQITAVGKVTRVSQSASEGEKTRSLSIQITKMNMSEMGDDMEADKESFRKGYKKGMR